MAKTKAAKKPKSKSKSKPAAKKPAAKQVAAKQVAAKKVAAKKTTTKRVAAKKPAAKKKPAVKKPPSAAVAPAVDAESAIAAEPAVAAEKPKSKSKSKPAAKKPAAKKPAATQVAAKKTTAKRVAATKPAAKKKPAVAGVPLTTRHEQLGEITVPSGKLAVFDIGLVGYLPRPALEPALVTTSVPADRPLHVIGRRVGTGRFADCWDHVAVKLGDGEVTHSQKLGEAGVDFARLVCMDHGALDHWQHEDSLDGLADFIFWGRDAELLARAIGAPATREGFGWTNLPLAEAEAKGMDAERKKSANHWMLATDFRPHSHHFHALAAARQSKHGAGTIDVGGARVCLFFTSWGDGVFPIYLDLDFADRPVQVRVQLNTAATLVATHAVNP